MRTYQIRSCYAPYRVNAFIHVFRAPSWETVLVDCMTGEVKSISRKQAVREMKRKQAVASLASTLALS